MNILVVAPHMDDEVLGAGGTICRHVAAGHVVHVCFVAHRKYGNTYSHEANELEMECACNAAGILGYRDIEFLGLEDEALDRELRTVIIPLEAYFKKVDPDIMYVCHGGDLNQDHRAVYHAACIVARPAAQNRLTRLLSYETPSSTDQAPQSLQSAFLPNHYVDIAPYLETKLEALKAYTTEVKEFPHPRSVTTLRALAQRRGSEANLLAAEAFTSLRTIWR